MIRINTFTQFLLEVARDDDKAIKLGSYLANRHMKRFGRFVNWGRSKQAIQHMDYRDHAHQYAALRAGRAISRWANSKDLETEEDVALHLPDIQKLPVKLLKSTQHATSWDATKAKAKFGDTKPIIVAKHNGQHWIINGHHRVMAAKLRGHQHVPAHYVDLDNARY